MTDTAVQQPVMRRGNKSQQCANNKKKKVLTGIGKPGS